LQKIIGFTLIELIIVIVIIAILAVIPFFNWPSTSLNLDGQAQQLANDIRYTQSLSMTKAQRYRLVITTGSSSYQILNSAGTAVRFASGNTTVTLASGISFGTLTNLPNSLIVFDGDGIPYTTTGSPGTALSANASIPLQAGGNTKTVVIVPLTGKVNVQ
jgi:prepilin-type N-terminal cleavage/methylation domain-containing protein